MCGIAGFSRDKDSSLDARALGRVLLASVADRGADAAGCAWHASEGIAIHKQRGGASAFLERFAVPADLDNLVLHVRDHTKGRPSLDANNHPIRHGRIVGVHNGRIENDDEIIEALGCGRAETGMTVDSEAIFAALNALPNMTDALARLRGSLATAWLDDTQPGVVFLARGYGRPLWTATTQRGSGIVWASTLEALEIVEEFLGITLHKRPLRPGTILRIADGRVVERATFQADATATWLANPVASPHERVACLARLEPRIA